MTEPSEHGLLDVGDGQLVYWESCGNPDGTPVLRVHGGPGSGCTARTRDAVDLERHRFVLFDQRGCGRSRPHVADPTVSLETNTTAHLVADMEALRRHLGVERWMLSGGSWGSTLILAYAQAHPERVAGLVIIGVTTTRQREIEWLYRGVGRFVPAAQQRFRAFVPEASDAVIGSGGVLDAYGRRMASPDAAVRSEAAREWARWEDAVIGHEVLGRPDAYSARPDRDLEAMVRICAHYFSHAGWLDEGVLLRGAPRLAGIPAILVHGLLDLAGPLETAWELARAWPDAELVVVDDAGHTGSPAMADQVRRAHRVVADRVTTPWR